MKKARKVVVQAQVSEKEFQRLADHLRNSALWYVANAPKSERALRQKFYEKGYPTGSITVQMNSGKTEERNLVEEQIAWLKLAEMLDDEGLARRKAEKLSRAGKGETAIRRALMSSGFSQTTIEEVLENSDEELKLLAVEKALGVIKRSSSYKKAESWRKNQVLYQKLISRGFSIDDIDTYKYLGGEWV